MKRKIRIWQRKLSKLPTLHLVIAVYSFLFVSYFSVVAYTVYSAPKFEAKVEKVQAERGQIAYYERGKGEPIILIPGFGMTMQHWDPEFIQKLSMGNTVIAFDYKGVGESTGDVRNITQQQMTDDVITLMDQLQIDKADIVGWSLGSFVAQDLAERYPNRVDKVVLVSTAPGGKESIPAPKRIQDEVAQNIDGSWEDVFVPMMFLDQTKKDEYLKHLKNAQASGEVPEGKGESIEAKVAHQLAFAEPGAEKARYDNLKDIQASTLLITGEKDEFTRVENAKKVENRIPNAQLHIIPDAGHAVIFENTDEVNDLIKEFIN